MAGFFGDNVANYVRKGAVSIVATAWRPLVSSGSTPLNGRRHIKIHVRGNVGFTLALAYANKNLDGTFTTPADDVRICTIYPGGSFITEPLGDGVNVYGRLVKKVGVTNDSVRCIVTEYM